MARYEGKCSACGQLHTSDRKGDLVVCDCNQHCPVCGATMALYQPDLAPNTYGLDGQRDFAVFMVCALHSPNFFSIKKPIEVACT